MALQGINLPLTFTGQESIWQKVFAVCFLYLFKTGLFYRSSFSMNVLVKYILDFAELID